MTDPFLQFFEDEARKKLLKKVGEELRYMRREMRMAGYLLWHQLPWEVDSGY